MGNRPSADAERPQQSQPAAPVGPQPEGHASAGTTAAKTPGDLAPQGTRGQNRHLDGILCLAGRQTTIAARLVAQEFGLGFCSVSTVKQALEEISSVASHWSLVVAALGTDRETFLFDRKDLRGSRIVEAAQAHGVHVLVYSHTACSHPRIVQACLRAGVDGVLNTPQQLRGLIQDYLSRFHTSEDKPEHRQGQKRKALLSPALSPRLAGNVEHAALRHASDSRTGASAGATARSQADGQTKHSLPPAASVSPLIAQVTSTLASQSLSQNGEPGAPAEISQSLHQARENLLAELSASGGAEATGEPAPVSPAVEQEEFIRMRRRRAKELSRIFGAESKYARRSRKLTAQVLAAYSECERTGSSLLLPKEHPAGEVLIHCGDTVGNYGRSDVAQDFDVFLQWIRRVSRDFRLVLFVAGNHDTQLDPQSMDFRQASLDSIKQLPRNVIYLQNDIMTYRGIRIFGSPVTESRLEAWGKRFVSNAFERQESKRKKLWDRLPAQLDILVTHAPTRCTSSAGDLMLTRRLKGMRPEDRPKVHCFGHDHDTFGVAMDEFPTRARTKHTASRFNVPPSAAQLAAGASLPFSAARSTSPNAAHPQNSRPSRSPTPTPKRGNHMTNTSTSTSSGQGADGDADAPNPQHGPRRLVFINAAQEMVTRHDPDGGGFPLVFDLEARE